MSEQEVKIDLNRPSQPPVRGGEAEPMVAIILPTHNRRKELAEMLRTLHSDRYPRRRIILIDDGSSDDTARFVADSFPDVEQLHGDGSLWWSGAINLGISAAIESDADLILWINDDNRLEPDTITEMVASYRRSGARSIICARTRSTATGEDEWVGEPPRWHPQFGNWTSPPLESDDVAAFHPPGGRGVLIPAFCFAEIGMVDQQCFPHYWADHDFHYRAMKAGYNYRIATRAVVWNSPNSKRPNDPDEFSTRWVLHFLFSRRSPMNLPTLHRLMKRHLAPGEYRTIFYPLLIGTLKWLASGWIVRHPYIYRPLKALNVVRRNF